MPSNTLIRLRLPQQAGDVTDESSEIGPRPWQRVDRWVTNQPDSAWTEVDVRDGEKGPLIVHALQLPVETRGWGRGAPAAETLVVIRYLDRDSRVVKTDYALSNAADGTPLEEYCRVAKAEHRIEECLQRCKSEAGMGDYEVRNWVGWQHHQTLSLLAAWYLNLVATKAKKKGAGNHVLSHSSTHRSGDTTSPRMRFTPQRPETNRTQAAPQSVGKVLSLETT